MGIAFQPLAHPILSSSSAPLSSPLSSSSCPLPTHPPVKGPHSILPPPASAYDEHHCFARSRSHQPRFKDQPRSLPIVSDGAPAPLAFRKRKATQFKHLWREKNHCRGSVSVVPLKPISNNVAFCMRWPLHESRDQTCHEGMQEGRHLHCFALWRSRGSHVCSAFSKESGHSGVVDIKAQDGSHIDDVEIPLESAVENSVMGEPYPQQKLGLSHINQGKTGFVTFYGPGKQQPNQITMNLASPTRNLWASLLWLVGPTALVSSVVLPPLYLRKLFEVVLEDSLVTDFLILFFTESLFYAGVAIFFVVAHNARQSVRGFGWKTEGDFNLGYKISSIITMALSVLLPIVTFAIVWPWTGPAAAAALVPYMAGLAVQFGFEQIIQERKSSVWPLIPVVFQVYRLHQLNRATQLVAGLLFSLKGAEATAEALAVNGSLQTLLTALQFLGMLCLWSLTAFLVHAFPSTPKSLDLTGLRASEIQ